MTFLNPLLLLALAAVAIPLLIHLLNLRKLKIIEFSSLRFLKELQKTQIRRLKLRQLLLLVLRILTVAALVLAFARPAMHGTFSGAIGTRATSTLVVLLDDSPSMEIRNESGILFQQAKDVVRSLLKLAQNGDELYLLRLSELNHGESFTAFYSPEGLEPTIEAAKPSRETVTFAKAAGVIARILAESRNINQEVYFVTDGQGSQFPIESKQTADLFDDRVKVFFVEIPPPQDPENLGIGSLSGVDQIVSVDKPLSFDVNVFNGGSSPTRNALLNLYLDGKREAQQSYDIQPYSVESKRLTATPTMAGILLGYLELEDDILDSDNRFHFVVNIPKRIRVALVGTPDATKYLQLAFSALRELGGNDPVSIETIDESRLTSLNVSAFDVIVLCDLKDLTSMESERLTQFAGNGGGLMIFPGDQMDAENFNRTLLRGIGIPGVRLPAPRSNEPTGSTGFRSFSTVEIRHPLFEGLFEPAGTTGQSRSTIESPQVLHAIWSSPGKTGNVLIELSDGTPFLTEYSKESGRVLLLAIDPGVSWSDFPLKGIYAPLLHRSVLYLSSTNVQKDPLTVGAPVSFTLRLPESNTALLVAPSGLIEPLAQNVNPVTGLTTFTSGPTREAGIYALFPGSTGESGRSMKQAIAATAVNVDPVESDLRTVTDEQYTTFCSAIGIGAAMHQRISATPEITQAVLESRFGVEFWKFLLAAAILFAICEMVIARSASGKQSTAEGTS